MTDTKSAFLKLFDINNIRPTGPKRIEDICFGADFCQDLSERQLKYIGFNDEDFSCTTQDFEDDPLGIYEEYYLMALSNIDHIHDNESIYH